MITKLINLHANVQIRVEYHPGTDSVYYTYTDNGDESLATTDLIKLLAEEDSFLDARGVTTVAIHILKIVNPWLAKINAK